MASCALAAHSGTPLGVAIPWTSRGWSLPRPGRCANLRQEVEFGTDGSGLPQGVPAGCFGRNADRVFDRLGKMGGLMSVLDGRSKATRYHLVAIILHWVIASLIVTSLVLAIPLQNVDGLGRGVLIRLHKSVGVTIFVLSVARWVWRFACPPAPLPARTTRALAHFVHYAFYALLIVLPLSGWAMISAAEPLRTTMVWGLVKLPPVIPLEALAVPTKALVHAGLGRAHLLLTWVFVALLALHLIGAFWHTLRREPGGVSSILIPRGTPCRQPSSLPTDERPGAK